MDHRISCRMAGKGNEPDTDGNSLEAGSLCNSDNGKTYGAGIGGDSTDPDFGTIIIESGNITAISQARINRSITICGAGIGGGYADNTSEQYSTDGTIIIKGGNIKAINEHDQNSTENGAGIGGGYKGTCTSIVITGGTVNAESAHGDDIGNGKDFVADNNTPTKPMLIVAPAEKGENLSVTETVVDTNNQLKGNGTSTTLTGTVTVPEGMQVYAPNITEEGTTHVLNAYNVKLNNTQLESEESGSGAHTANNFPDAISDTYYGKSTTDNPTTVTVPVNVTCSWGHHFIGWYSTSEIKDTEFTINVPTTDPNDRQSLYEGDAVWVDNYHDIVVANLHTWTKGNSDAPTISVEPEEAISLLEFTLNKGSKAGTRLNDVQLDDNVFTGTPALLVPNESYANLDDVTVTVKVKNKTTEKEVKTPIFIHSDNLVITGVTLQPNHTYDGYAHNNTRDDESGYHAFAFNVEVTGDESIKLPEGFTLTEGVHYVVESFQVDGQTPTSTTEVKGSKQIIDAGIYSNIVLKSVTQEEDGQEYGVKFKIGDVSETTEYTISGNLTVAKRNLTLEAINSTITLPENSTEPDFTDWEEYVKVNGIATVNGALDNVDPEITAKVNSTEKEWWTIPGTYTATFTIESLTGNKADNYQEGATATITIKVGSYKDEENDTDRPGHIERPAKYYNIYIDTVCPGLKLELSKDVVKEGGQVSVYLTVEEQCDTTGFAFEYKRGLFGRWEDLKPLEGVQPGEYIIKYIYTDIYIRALDAIVEEEEEPTGIEDVEGVKVYAQDGNIYVYTPNRERVMIVSMNGALVKNAEQEGMQSYSVSRGIYIVRIGDKVFKIKN